MLVPRFQISQDDETVTVKIFAPNSRIQNTEVTVCDDMFYFSSTPYYLRLHMPHRLRDSELEGCTAFLDADQNAYVVVCKKEQPGLHFPGLDMITNLLTPSTKASLPSIEVISSEEPAEETIKQDSVTNFDENWYELHEFSVDDLKAVDRYGFADKYSQLPILQEAVYGVIELVSPNNSSPEDRRAQRLLQEKEKFAVEHYLCDLYDLEETLSACFKFIPYYNSLLKGEFKFSDEEQSILLSLPRRELFVEHGKPETQVFVGLASILMGYAYNVRINCGDECAEAAWNISRLSPLFCWLDHPHGVTDAVQAFVRRCLVFPLLRRFDFALLVRADVVALLRAGRIPVLKSLLDIRKIFNTTENYYILNDIFITDYCIWIQTVSDDKLSSLAYSLEKVKVVISDLHLDLEKVESEAFLDHVRFESEASTSEALVPERVQFTVGKAAENKTSTLSQQLTSLSLADINKNEKVIEEMTSRTFDNPRANLVSDHEAENQSNGNIHVKKNNTVVDDYMDSDDSSSFSSCSSDSSSDSSSETSSSSDSSSTCDSVSENSSNKQDSDDDENAECNESNKV